jgi:dihydrofolate synthase/folylpolyglutamate synthase
MNYNEAISFLFSSLPMYQRVGRAAYKSDLKNTLALDEHFGHPHLAFRSIHVAGTNGKGSVAHMLAAVFQEAGFRTGLYTSPHLKDFRERIRINGEMIPEDRVTAFVNEHHAVIREVVPSFFEMTVSMAFDHFARQKVDLAVVEVGMGGRLDSTNIIHPMLSVITNIGMDHSQFLGDTLYKIAREKAGIMKPGVPAVIGQKQQDISVVFERRAMELDCSLHFADQEYRVETVPQSPKGKQLMQVYRHGEPLPGPLELDLLGHYQQKNLATVLKAIDVMRELEILGHDPMIVCDTAHNTEGIEEVLLQIRNMPWKNLHFILGMVNDKDPRRLLSLLPQKARYYFTQASIPRAMDREKLAREAMEFGLHGQVCPSPSRALEIACSEASADDLIFAGGSIFLIAELL